MQAQNTENDVAEVNKQLLWQLEDMGFSLARAARALHHSGNAGLEAAINWIIDHENDQDIDKMPLIAINIDIETPQPLTEEMHNKVLELRDQARKIKEEENRTRERETEKERIRAGKEILEAKRIAEDNERKRNIALMIADKEEQKRAREKVRQKLEADKAERRRMLGLPPLISNSAPNPSRNVVQEKKNLFYSSKVEQLRECLRSIRRNHKDDDASVKRAFQTLLIYVGNVAKNPDVEKFRKIRIRNPLFQDRVGRLDGGIEFLELCGFEGSEEGKFLFLPRYKVDMALLNSAGSEIRSALTNPFFGLLSSG